MKTAAQNTFRERVGRTLGRLWRGCVRLDRRAMQVLMEKGCAPGMAKGLVRIVELAVLAGLLYAAFWFAAILVIVALVAWGFRHQATLQEDDSNQPEWREGHGGFGLYDKNEWRHDMGDPDKS
jgi:fatty acid desaturase